jgi:Tol biopolymer transport system component
MTYPKKYIYVGSLLLLSIRITVAVPWPLQYEPHYIGNNYGEYQYYEGYMVNPEFHDGIDIMAPAYTPIYAVEAGTVKAKKQFGPDDHYWGIAIQNSNQSRWYYVHLCNIEVEVNDEVEFNQQLALVVDWEAPDDFDHLHFKCAKTDGVANENPLNLLENNQESYAPTFEEAYGNDWFAFCKNNTSEYFSAPNTEIGALYGDVDIIAKISDIFYNTNTIWDIVSPCSVKYAVYDEDNIPVVSPTTSVIFSGSLPVDGLLSVVYKNDEVCKSEGDYGHRNFYYIVTNTDGDGWVDPFDISGCWHTHENPNGAYNGKYYVEVTAYDQQNNSSSARMEVQVKNNDVGVTQISPTGDFDSCYIITPTATVKNFGTGKVSFTVTFKIATDPPYSSTASVQDLNSGDTRDIVFGVWTPRRGTFTVKCSTKADNDYDRTNDAMTGQVVVQVHDVSVDQIISPEPDQQLEEDEFVDLEARVFNYGTVTENVGVKFFIRFQNSNENLFWYPQNVIVEPNQYSAIIHFAQWQGEEGSYVAKCSTCLWNDPGIGNDAHVHNFEVVEGGGPPPPPPPPPGTRSDNPFDPPPPGGSGSNCTPEDPCGNCCICFGDDPCCICCPGSCSGCCVCSPGSCNGCCVCRSGDDPPLPREGWRRHTSVGNFRTCWHWKTGNPWSANPTHYMLLDWDFTGGTVVESLISPVVSLANCTTATLCCSTYFDHKHNSYTAQLRGSVDGGASYPYLIKNYAGSDFGPGAESFNISSWAAEQPRVRLAWYYTGGVDKIDFWALDNVRIIGFPGYEHDVAVTDIRAPIGQIPLNSRLKPKVLVSNFGNNQDTFRVYCKIDQIYTDSVSFILQQGGSCFLYFDEWLATLGSHTIRAYATLANDNNRANDTFVSTFEVVANTWLAKDRTPQKIKAGGSLVTAGKYKLYALTGYPNMSFTRYIPVVNQWRRMASPPHDVDGGAALAWTDTNYIYMLEGGTSNRFYRYNMNNNTWITLSNTPQKIGLGGALAWAGSDYLYALRGNEKRSFYRYRISTNSWDSLTQTPGKIRQGGALAWDRSNYFYALRGSNEQSFYRYQINNNGWVTLTPTPATVSSGGSLAYDTANNKVFAFRGKETNEFWVFNPSTNSWQSRASTPYHIGTGGALTYYNGSIFGLRGSNERDFWNYALQAGGDYGGSAPDTTRERSPGAPLGGGEVSIVLDSLDNALPVISPDGNWVCYQKLDTVGSYQLYKISIQGGSEILLTSDTFSYTNPQWSPDGSWIVCERDGEIYKLRNDGTDGVILATGICANPQWSPDGNQIVFTRWDGNHKLFKVSPDSCLEEQLTNDECDVRFPQWFPNGEWVVYQKLTNESYQLCKCSLATGVETQLTHSIYDNTDPCVSPDGSWLVYEKVDENGYRQIYKISSDGGEETVLTTEACDHESPKIAPDGSWVTYAKWVDAGESHICQNLVQSATETVLTEGDAVREKPDISPYGNLIVYACDYDVYDRGSDNRSIYRVRVNSTGIDYDGESRLFRRLALYQNQPNPAKSALTIRYEIPIESKVSLKIYDVSGKLVKTLIDELVKPGSYTVCWNRKDNDNKEVSTGIYYYRLYAKDKYLLKKAVLLK